jgi:hypothetical protein
MRVEVARLIGALVGVRSEQVALCLNQISGMKTKEADVLWHQGFALPSEDALKLAMP